MASLKVTYFPVKVRAEPIRVALRYAKIPFEDSTVAFKEWGDGVKDSTPGHALPTVTKNGKTFTQSLALARWAAKKSDLYPVDADAALVVDECMDHANEILVKFPQSKSEEEKKQKRQEFAATTLKVKFDFLASKIQEGPFLLGNKISIADLVIYFFALEPLRTGFFDYIPSTYTDAWPKLAALETAVKTSPLLSA